MTRSSQTWALALDAAFLNPVAPTVAELNDARFVHFISCALSEDGTELVLGDSETDDTISFCDIGSATTLTQNNITATLTWFADANTGGSGSTVDLTSLYNKVTAMLDYADVPYYLISRTGAQGSQDTAFASGQVIKLAKFLTDVPTLVLDSGAPVRKSQSLLYQAVSAWNFTLA